MASIEVINRQTQGVDMRVNPLYLRNKFASAVNVAFSENTIHTRPGIDSTTISVAGRFQGVNDYHWQRGVGADAEGAYRFVGLTWAIGGKAYSDPLAKGVLGNISQCSLGELPVTIYQAECYQIFQSPGCDTAWWDSATMTCSIGLNCSSEEDADSHDTFCETNHKNWLVNAAGAGIYAHGRIHQVFGRDMYVSDLVGKRGKGYSDVLLMEEQVQGSFDDPIPSYGNLGAPVALEILNGPSVFGEGELIAYHEHGVRQVNTFQFPRQTRYDAEGTLIQRGWSTQKLTNTVIHAVSAVSRYAVTRLPADHLFRSTFGLHLLRRTLGEGSFNDETTLTISQDVDPLMQEEDSLSGAATGYWKKGSRYLASVGMISSPCSVDSVARGFVVRNNAYTHSEDLTPKGIWEGVWCLSPEAGSIIKFQDFQKDLLVISGKDDLTLLTSKIEKHRRADRVDGRTVQIPWHVVTRVFQPAGIASNFDIDNGRLDLFLDEGSVARVMIRVDNGCWVEWRRVSCSGYSSTPLDKPPVTVRVGNIFQIKVEGVGYGEILAMNIEATSIGRQTKSTCSPAGCCVNDAFEYNKSYPKWPTLA